MPSVGQDNLETVMIDFFGALRRGDFEAAAGLLDHEVSWQGLREEWACQGREEVLETFRWGLKQRREIDALGLRLDPRSVEQRHALTRAS